MDFFGGPAGSKSDPGMGRYVGSDALCSKINFKLRDQKIRVCPTVVKYRKSVVWCGTLQMVLLINNKLLETTTTILSISHDGG
jgi:hypothetical protein